MGEFFVVFDASPETASDAFVGKEPLASSKVLAPLMTARVAYVEASTAANASAVVNATYGPQAGVAVSPIAGTGFSGVKPIAVTKAEWKES
jgi:hypothetical protein